MFAAGTVDLTRIDPDLRAETTIVRSNACFRACRLETISTSSPSIIDQCPFVLPRPQGTRKRPMVTEHGRFAGRH